MNTPNSNELSFFDLFTVTYSSNDASLQGYLLLPEGPGPFPAVIFQHGSSGLLSSNRAGVEALKHMGYAVFVALRRGHNGNPGSHWLSLITAPWGSPQMGKQLMKALDGETDDVLAALDWLHSQPQIDPERIAIVGHSFGGAVTVLAAKHTNRFHAGISFAGPSQTWPDAPALQEAMVTAIQSTTIPSFRFVGQQGRFTAFRGYECSPRTPWWAHRQIRNHSHKRRLGLTDSMSVASLELAATSLQALV